MQGEIYLQIEKSSYFFRFETEKVLFLQESKMINRLQRGNLLQWMNKGKALVLIGPRQVGKTTLVQQISDEFDAEKLWLTGDDPQVRAMLKNISIEHLKKVVGKHKLIVVDEAQRLHNAGLFLKLITDHFKGVHLLVTGSSSLDLAAETSESLVGRKFELPLYPLSFPEMAAHHGYVKERSLLEYRMVYGYYPEVVKNDENTARKILNELTESLMYKDLLTLDKIKKPSLLPKLLQALALQLGSEVKYKEIGNLIGADSQTVERYISLLEKSYVIFRLPSLNRSLRNEIKKGKKVYFYDNGIRNAVIKNFNPIELRQDVGALWESFLIAERKKHTAYNDVFHNAYFWRTKSQQEIDYIEDANGKLNAYEFKWRSNKKVRFPSSFSSAYPNSEVQLINRDNFEAFVGF